jgi:hypothetical protein
MISRSVSLMMRIYKKEMKRNACYYVPIQWLSVCYFLCKMHTYNCYKSRHYPSSYFKTLHFRDRILSPSSDGTYSVRPNRESKRTQNPVPIVALNERQDAGYVHNYTSYINITSSQTCRLYRHVHIPTRTCLCICVYLYSSFVSWFV